MQNSSYYLTDAVSCASFRSGQFALRKQNNEEKIRARYDRLAPIYDERWAHYVYESLEYLVTRLAIRGPEKVLDVACGTGVLEELLSRRYPSVAIVGIDVSERMLLRAKEKARLSPNTMLVSGTASALPIKDEMFDRVVCASAFHFFANPQAVLREFKRVLKPRGRILVLDWCKDYLSCRLCDIFLRLFDSAYQGCYGQKDLRYFLEAARFDVLVEEKFRVGFLWGMMIAEAEKAACVEI